MDIVQSGRITASSLIPQTSERPSERAPGAFASLLSDAVQRVGELQTEADQELRRLLGGEPVELHRVLLASEKAGLASQLMMSVRNKVVDAYQEIMRMQV